MKTNLYKIACGALIAAALLPPSTADAQLRNQTRIINQAINNQARLAFRPQLVVRNAAGPVDAMDIDSSGRFFAVASRDGGLRVWDFASGRQIGRVNAGRVRSVATTPGDRFVVVGTEKGHAALWDVGVGKELRRFAGHKGAVTAVRVSPDGSTVATAGVDGSIKLWNATTGRNTATLSGGKGPVNALAFDPAGDTLASGGRDEPIRLWSVRDGQARGALAGGAADVRALGFGADGVLYAAGADGVVLGWPPGSDGPQRTFRGAGGEASSMVLGSDGAILVAGGGSATVLSGAGREVGTVSGDAGASLSVFAPGDGKVLMANADGRVVLWDVKNKRRLAQLILTSGGWSVVDVAGRYDGSNGGLSDVSWRTDSETFEMHAFSEPYYEPGLLAKLLHAPDALLTPSAQPIESGIAPPPLVELSVDSATGPGPGQVTVAAQDRGGAVTKVVLYHNGKAVPDSRIASRQTVSGGIVSIAYNVDLIGGENHFRAVAVGDSLVESVPAVSTVTVGANGVEKPALHLVVIGINQYANPTLALNYAINDAKGITNWAKQKGVKAMYRDVIVHELYDKEASRDNIKKIMSDLKSTLPHDIVVIYLAGHGESSDNNWFFLPSEFGQGITFPDRTAADARSLAGFRQTVLKAVAKDGVPSQAIKQAIGEIGAQRVILLIDACKSGSIRTAFNADADNKNLQTLSKQAGVHILAATDKDQYAAELSELKHGVFTYIMLMGLSGKADNSPRNGFISAQEILSFTADEVPTLAFLRASSAQFPTTFSQGADFEIGPAAKRLK